jgi:intein/homing endonuclease
LTRRGWLAVEAIAQGDEVASRHESDDPVAGAVEWKAVEATFRRTGRVLHLHFPDGELIRTTPEHPFFVEGKGWAAAGALKEGDRIATLSGEWVPVAGKPTFIIS